MSYTLKFNTKCYKSLTMNLYSNESDLKKKILLSAWYKHLIIPHNKHKTTNTREQSLSLPCMHCFSCVSIEQEKRKKMKEKWKGVKQFTVERFQSNSPPFRRAKHRAAFPLLPCLSRTHTRSSRTLLSLMTIVIHWNKLWCKCE